MSEQLDQHEAWKLVRARLDGVAPVNTAPATIDVAADDQPAHVIPTLDHVRNRSARQIIVDVATKYQVSPRAVLGSTRSRDVVRARHEICWRLRHEVMLGGKPISLLQIGKIMRLDHSTVIHAIRRHSQRMMEKSS